MNTENTMVRKQVSHLIPPHTSQSPSPTDQGGIEDKARSGNYLAVHEALSALRALNVRLTDIEEGNRMEAALRELIALASETYPSFRALYQACAWLPSTSKGMVLSIAVGAAHRLAMVLHTAISTTKCPFTNNRAETEAVSTFKARACAMRISAEVARWCAISYQEMPSSVQEGMASNYSFLSSLGNSGELIVDDGYAGTIDAEYLGTCMLQNLHTERLRRSEIICVVSAIEAWAGEVSLRDTPLPDIPCIAVDIASGFMWLQKAECPALSGTKYIDRIFLDMLFRGLDRHGKDPERIHYRRWLSRGINRFSPEQYQVTRRGERAARRKNCRVYMNYMPIMERLRSAASGRTDSASGMTGDVLDASNCGCMVSFNVSDVNRPAVGRLVMVDGLDDGGKIGVIRWIKSSTCHRRATVGVEYFDGTPRVIGVSASTQWVNGTYVEKSIYLDSDMPAESEPLRFIQRRGSHLDERVIDVGCEARRLEHVMLVERGLDFDLVSCE